jgi:hypothetical protein
VRLEPAEREFGAAGSHWLERGKKKKWKWSDGDERKWIKRFASVLVLILVYKLLEVVECYFTKGGESGLLRIPSFYWSQQALGFSYLCCVYLGNKLQRAFQVSASAFFSNLCLTISRSLSFSNFLFFCGKNFGWCLKGFFGFLRFNFFIYLFMVG